MRRPYTPKIGRKQTNNHETFAYAARRIRFTVPVWWADHLVETAAAKVKRWCDRYGELVYGWSGGKDSIALQVVMEAAGIDATPVLIATELEYPAFDQWISDSANIPSKLDEVRQRDVSLPWLLDNLDWLFPTCSAQSNKWFDHVQRRGWRTYYNEHQDQIGGFCLGRRIADGNWPKEVCEDHHDRKWIAPILRWTHEDVLAVCAYSNLPMPPFYRWPRGYIVGTGPWAKRKCKTFDQAWREIASIDPSILVSVTSASPGTFPEAERALIEQRAKTSP